MKDLDLCRVISRKLGFRPLLEHLPWPWDQDMYMLANHRLHLTLRNDYERERGSRNLEPEAVLQVTMG